MAEKRTFGALSVRSLHGKVCAAYALSRIAQLYAEPQGVVMAPGPQELPRCGKDQLKQNEYAGSCIGVSGKTLLLGSWVNRGQGRRFGCRVRLVRIPLRFLLGVTLPKKEQCMANLSVGERFPAFILPDERGEPFDLREELAQAPLMLVFYRGDW